MKILVCPICETQFPSQKAQQIYCGARCRQKAERIAKTRKAKEEGGVRNYAEFKRGETADAMNGWATLLLSGAVVGPLLFKDTVHGWKPPVGVEFTWELIPAPGAWVMKLTINDDILALAKLGGEVEFR